MSLNTYKNRESNLTFVFCSRIRKSMNIKDVRDRTVYRISSTKWKNFNYFLIDTLKLQSHPEIFIEYMDHTGIVCPSVTFFFYVLLPYFLSEGWRVNGCKSKVVVYKKLLHDPCPRYKSVISHLFRDGSTSNIRLPLY